MKDWIKFFGFHIPYFILVGAIGGMTWLYALKSYYVNKGDISGEQVSHIVKILKQSPNEFRSMIRLLEEERLPLSEKEKMLFEERGRFKVERLRFEKDRKVWEVYREEELSRLREEKKRQDDIRAEVDQKMEILKNKEKMVSELADQIITEKYKKYIDTLVKMEALDVAQVIIDRPTKEIVQDLRQFKDTFSAGVIKEMLALREKITDEIEKDDFDTKMSEVITLYRAEGLR